MSTPRYFTTLIEVFSSPEDLPPLTLLERYIFWEEGGCNKLTDAREHYPELWASYQGLCEKAGVQCGKILVEESSLPTGRALTGTGTTVISTAKAQSSLEENEATFAHEIIHHKHAARDISVLCGARSVAIGAALLGGHFVSQKARDKLSGHPLLQDLATVVAFTAASRIALEGRDIALHAFRREVVEPEADLQGARLTGKPEVTIAMFEKYNAMNKEDAAYFRNQGNHELANLIESPNISQRLHQSHPDLDTRIAYLQALHRQNEAELQR